MTVPRWGVHHDIKYSPRRSILKICPICNEFFLQVSRGKKKYCSDLCSVKGKQKIQRNINQDMIKQRDKKEHANYMKLYRHDNPSNRRLSLGTTKIPSPKLDEDGTTNWSSYHQTLHNELQKLGLISPH